MDALLKSKSKIIFWTGCDPKHKLFEKLAYEWSLVPLVNHRSKEDISGLLDKSHRIALVCITGFFDEGGDFVFFVKGYKNLANFLKLTFSGRAYDDPCFATSLSVFSFQQLIDTPGLECLATHCVGKTETKGLRWRYLYKSAVNAWDKLEFDEQKYFRIRERLLMNQAPLKQALSDTEEDTDMDDDTDTEMSDDEEDDDPDGLYDEDLYDDDDKYEGSFTTDK
ncbi:uncharacterized protein N0V89_012476 [Didymosphaeria variabile]|uniref:Uncharacterized protein n=1 Tax=Didymosphaeria variabile TaxID=1932322 RepID=A0A9W8X988_9PLEO|nr:uncharacterized protein N0V89_012476 [Didymosphaeria variabile]KAJ4344732.1 hypothetical protein N0V89_012476 [Didymosphaeria variabile]